MFSLDKLITYTGSAAIIYLLIKAFGGDSISNINGVILVGGIMIIIIFLVNKNSTCKKENFKSISPPMKEAIFKPYDYQPLSDKKFDYGTKDKDLIDMMNIAGIDKQKFEQMMESEKLAKEEIKSRYANEMVYTDSNPFNTVPLGRQLNSYTYLPEYAWFRGYEKPPVCIPSGSQCPTCPLATQGTTELMHFSNVDSYEGRAPEDINLKYTKNVLNFGIPNK